MLLSYVSLTAKRQLIIFKYDEATDILASPLCNFHMLKNVRSKTQQKSFSHFLAVPGMKEELVHDVKKAASLVMKMQNTECGVCVHAL